METLIVIALLLGSLALGEKVVHGLRGVSRSPEDRELLARATTTIAASTGTEERTLLKGCANCRVQAFTLPFRDGSGRTYCSEECLISGALGPTTFCAQCLGDTTEHSTGDVRSVNGIGRNLGKPHGRCRTCRSVVRQVWFTLLFVPLIPLGRYRCIHSSPYKFSSRRIR